MNTHANIRPYSKHQDDELLVAVARGDRQALDSLYLGYHRRLTRFLSGIVPHHEKAEEIINDTFVVVWQHAKDFRRAARVSTWIIGIAYRIALKSLRRTEEAATETVDSLQTTTLRDRVTYGLRQLPPEQRLTLELAYHLGHSCEEIAEISESPVGTVKTRMVHARDKLRAPL